MKAKEKKNVYFQKSEWTSACPAAFQTESN